MGSWVDWGVAGAPEWILPAPFWTWLSLEELGTSEPRMVTQQTSPDPQQQPMLPPLLTAALLLPGRASTLIVSLL